MYFLINLDRNESVPVSVTTIKENPLSTINVLYVLMFEQQMAQL